VGPGELEEVIKMDLECDLEIMRLNGKKPSNIKSFARIHRNNFLAAYNEPVEQRIFGAKVGNALVGFVWVRIEPEIEEMVPVGFVESIFVKSEYRGNGLGKALIRSAERFCKGKGVSRLELVVNAKNRSAIDFYRSMGFKARRYTLERRLVPAR
jgi:ribosomal protein S18 acetylase RimI-like enzyme